MKKRRFNPYGNKQEIIHKMQTLQAMKADKDDLQHKSVFFRIGVECGITLCIAENFTRAELKRFYKYMAKADIANMTDENREKLRQGLLDVLGWAVWRDVSVKKCKSKSEQMLEEQNRYNAKSSTDYMLVALTFLVKEKHIPSDRARDFAETVVMLDSESVQTIIKARETLYDQKGIWIELNDDCPCEEGREVEVI